MERYDLVGLIGDAVAESSQRPRFADARFAGHQHAAHLALAALNPALAEHVELGATADQRGQPPARPDFEAIGGLDPRHDPVDLHWIRDTFQ